MKHTRQILADLAVILSKDDDLLPPEMPCEGPEYDEWNRERNELVEEFEQRSGLARRRAKACRMKQTPAVKARVRQIAEVLAKELVVGPRGLPGEAYIGKKKGRR